MEEFLSFSEKYQRELIKIFDAMLKVNGDLSPKENYRIIANKLTDIKKSIADKNSIVQEEKNS